MARASIRTHLSLDRYAQILGINPVHFAGAFAGDYFPLHNSCGDMWRQYSWQYSDSVGREDIALAISQVEEDIKRELGWSIAPTWEYQEVRDFPRHYRKDAFRRYGRDVRGGRVGVKAEYARIIAPGRRGVTAIKTDADVVYSDEDGDGFAETATVTAETTLTDVFEIGVFTSNKSGAETWEIRPPRSKSVSGGIFTATFWSWQMIDPEGWEQFPTSATFSNDTTGLIDISGLSEIPVVTTNLVTTVDIYRVYNDTVTKSCELMWEPISRNSSVDGTVFCTSCGGTGCEACSLVVQDGCLHVKDPLRGIVVPTPATYSETNLQWNQVAFSTNRDPDIVKMWYQAGLISNDWLAGTTYDPLSNRWAYAIAAAATARLERPFCSCGNLAALFKKWQADVSVGGEDYNIPFNDVSNPIGTHYGEIILWREIKRERHVIRGGGAV